MRINKDTCTNILAGCVAAVGLFTAASVIRDSIEYDKKQIKDISAEIKEKDPERYFNIINKITDGKLQNTRPNWQKELDIMNDSLKIDSLCKKAYFDGAQMVRDSIKTAAKLK